MVEFGFFQRLLMTPIEFFQFLSTSLLHRFFPIFFFRFFHYALSLSQFITIPILNGLKPLVIISAFLVIFNLLLVFSPNFGSP